MSFEVEKGVMDRYQKAFVGEVLQPGMTYNIQNAFHRQGYFGVKVTPLGANLTLLEGQEEGEVQALIDDAKTWLDQWFKNIRPWSSQEVDKERVAWLRAFGIPSHAWNDLFFAQLVKPWGVYMHSDEGTTKKTTMDVARLLIRTSCQQPVDEFFDVLVNGEKFRLRVIEDSYGPMRIIDPDTVNSKAVYQQGFSEDEEDDEEDDEDEEVEGIGRMMDEEVAERDSNGEPRNLIALTSQINATNDQDNFLVAVTGGINEQDNILDTNDSISSFSRSGELVLEVGDGLKDNNLIKGKILMDQECVVGGSQNVTFNHLIVKGGGINRMAQSANVGQTLSLEHVKDNGGVYSDGPRNVYLKLNKALPDRVEPLQPLLVPTKTTTTRVHPIPAGIRRKQKLIKDLHLGTPSSSSIQAAPIHWLSGKASDPSGTVHGEKGVLRKHPQRLNSLRKHQQSSSLSSAGVILCCSSINSTDIRNCNKRFVANFQQEAAKKVWKEVTVLGVVGMEGDDAYVKRILNNENEEDEARVQREQHQHSIP
jgi:hypothetical protein